jgi:pimeloyl-ACP methyl ester carboxylesterase
LVLEMVEITRRDVQVDGGALACFSFGVPDGEPSAVAVHGITGNSRSWLPVARALGDRGVLVAPDIRGRGRSSGLPGPYGLDVHVRDLLAVLDALGLERAVLVGHSLGAYIVARLGVAHPDRVRALVLVDGGLTVPGSENVDPQQFLDALLGPALARLQMRFADRDEYRDWWRAHPALCRGDVADEVLVAYADHDLVGDAPEMRSCVVEEAVRADAVDVVHTGDDAARVLTVRARLLCAPRGLLDEPNPMQPLPLVRAWAAADPGRRDAVLVPDVNHYTLTMGAGAPAVADAIASLYAEPTSVVSGFNAPSAGV